MPSTGQFEFGQSQPVGALDSIGNTTETTREDLARKSNLSRAKHPTVDGF